MLSVIMPFVNEFPQVLFTVQSLINNLSKLPKEEWEIILINNYCQTVEKQGRKEDEGYNALSKIAEKWPNIHVIRYDEKLSHWNAKNAGVEVSSGDVLFFCDAHIIIPSYLLSDMYREFFGIQKALGFPTTLHLPILYMGDSPENKLVYRMRVNKAMGSLHYVFHKFYNEKAEHWGACIQVPCMSSCGMMVSRETFTDIYKGFPKELGIYGGGENFMNFVGSVLGVTHEIFGDVPIQHYAAERGYNFNHQDWMQNRAIATYLFGGERWLENFIDGAHSAQKGHLRTLRIMAEKILYNPSLVNRRSEIVARQVTDIDPWIDQFKGSEFYEQMEVWV